MSERVVWVTGGPSRIGAAFVETVPHESARVVNITCRLHLQAEYSAADLLRRMDQHRLEGHIRDVLPGGVDRAHVLHRASEIWSAIDDGIEQGATVRVGLKDDVAEAMVDEQSRFEVR